MVQEIMLVLMKKNIHLKKVLYGKEHVLDVDIKKHINLNQKN